MLLIITTTLLLLLPLQFKDFKDFVDARKEELQDKQVLMYCTGGVRCERASAYLRLCGGKDVSQLSGGIHAYQEAFPAGEGYFRGKNFVYDRRIAVPHQLLDEVVGACRRCRAQYDDYKPQVRARSGWQASGADGTVR
jgi:predicted sulfurtransferase